MKRFLFIVIMLFSGTIIAQDKVSPPGMWTDAITITGKDTITSDIIDFTGATELIVFARGDTSNYGQTSYHNGIINKTSIIFKLVDWFGNVIKRPGFSAEIKTVVDSVVIDSTFVYPVHMDTTGHYYRGLFEIQAAEGDSNIFRVDLGLLVR